MTNQDYQLEQRYGWLGPIVIDGRHFASLFATPARRRPKRQGRHKAQHI